MMPVHLGGGGGPQSVGSEAHLAFRPSDFDLARPDLIGGGGLTRHVVISGMTRHPGPAFNSQHAPALELFEIRLP